MRGQVKWFNTSKGFGFVAPEGGGKDVFVHVSALHKAGIQSLADGVTVEFDVEQGKKGLQAANVRLI